GRGTLPRRSLSAATRPTVRSIHRAPAEAAVWRGLHDNLDDLGTRHAQVQCSLFSAAWPKRFASGSRKAVNAATATRALSASLQSGTEPDFAIAIRDRRLIERAGHWVVRRRIALAAAFAAHFCHQRSAAPGKCLQRGLRRWICRKRQFPLRAALPSA